MVVLLVVIFSSNFLTSSFNLSTSFSRVFVSVSVESNMMPFTSSWNTLSTESTFFARLTWKNTSIWKVDLVASIWSRKSWSNPTFTRSKRPSALLPTVPVAVFNPRFDWLRMIVCVVNLVTSLSFGSFPPVLRYFA